MSAQAQAKSAQLHSQLFDYTPAVAKLRTEADAQGNIWFVAADVCNILGLKNITMALKVLDDDEQALNTIEGLSRGNDQANFISESGLYHLIFKSRKEEARQFRRWVTSEVLPQIRKTGKYTAQASKPRAVTHVDPRQKWGCQIDVDAMLEFEGLPIRFSKQSGSLRFVARDCCNALGYTKANGAMQRLHADYKLLEVLPDTLGRKHEKNTLAMAGVLALAAKCRLPAAQRFYDFMRDHALASASDKAMTVQS